MATEHNFTVHVPMVGHASVTVRAATKQEAIEKAVLEASGNDIVEVKGWERLGRNDWPDPDEATVTNCDDENERPVKLSLVP